MTLPDSRVKIFQEQFRAVDQRTGTYVVDLPYRIEMPDGSLITGRTDDKGRTERVSTTDPQGIKLFWEHGITDPQADQSSFVEGC